MTTDPTPRDVRRALTLWVRQARLHERALEQMEADLAPLHLTVMEFDLLNHVGRAPGLTQQELAGRLLVTKGNVTYQLGKLEARGLLVRRTEGRCNRLFLTPEGEVLVARAVPAQNALHARRFAHLSRAEQDALAHLLRRALDAPEAAAPEVPATDPAPQP